MKRWIFVAFLIIFLWLKITIGIIKTKEPLEITSIFSNEGKSRS